MICLRAKRRQPRQRYTPQMAKGPRDFVTGTPAAPLPVLGGGAGAAAHGAHHFWAFEDRLVPQESQNFAPARTWLWHAAHSTVAAGAGAAAAGAVAGAGAAGAGAARGGCRGREDPARG